MSTDKSNRDNLEHNENNMDGVDTKLVSELLSLMPSIPTYDFVGDNLPQKTFKDKIDDANKSVEDKIVDAYVKAETAKLKQQKPIAIFVLVIFLLQLGAFNTIMFFVVLKAITVFESTNFISVIDFLKYYVGAVVIELIALVTIIVKGSYSLNTNKIVEKIINRKKL